MLESSAKAGSGSAMYSLASIYRAARDKPRAATWLLLASRHGQTLSPGDWSVLRSLSTEEQDEADMYKATLPDNLRSEPGIRDLHGPAVVMRNDQRTNDLAALASGLIKYAGDHGLALPARVSKQPQQVCRAGTACDGISLDPLLGKYLQSIPTDPQIDPNTAVTGYTVSYDGDYLTLVAVKGEWGPITEIYRISSFTRSARPLWP